MVDRRQLAKCMCNSARDQLGSRNVDGGSSSLLDLNCDGQVLYGALLRALLRLISDDRADSSAKSMATMAG